MENITEHICETASDCIFRDDEGIEFFQVCNLAAGDEENLGVCQCSPWYGFIGDECDVRTIQVPVFQTVLIGFSVWSSGIILFLLWYVSRYQCSVSGFKKIMNREIDPVVIISVLSLLGALCLLLNGILNLRALFDPTKFSVVKYDFLLAPSSEDVSVEHGKVAANAVSVAYSFFILASMQMSLSWLNLVKSASQFFPEKYLKNMARFKKFVYISYIIYFILGIISLITSLFNAFVMVMAAMNFVVVILFYRGRRAFKKIANMVSPETNEGVAASIKLVNRTSKLHMILLFAIFLTQIGFTLTSPIYMTLVSPGMNFILVIHYLGVFLGLVLLTSNCRYISILLSTLIKTNSASTSKYKGNSTSAKNDAASPKESL